MCACGAAHRFSLSRRFTSMASLGAATWRPAMHDTIAKQIDAIGEASVSPQPPTHIREAYKASGLYVIRAVGDEQAPPSSRRGASRSWIPGAADARRSIRLRA